MAAGPESAPASLAEETARIRGLHEQRALAEIAAADATWPGAGAVPWSGSLMPSVALIKGLAGPAESAGGAALSGADGEAAAKALEALGHDPAQSFAALSRPDASASSEVRAVRVRLLVEAVDAPIVIALDAESAEDLARAFGVDRLGFGKAVRVAGRRLLGVDGLEASLADEKRKRRVWAQLKAAAPAAPVY